MLVLNEYEAQSFFALCDPREVRKIELWREDAIGNECADGTLTVRVFPFTGDGWRADIGELGATVVRERPRPAIPGDGWDASSISD